MKAVGLYRYLPIDNPESLLDLEVETPTASGHAHKMLEEGHVIGKPVLEDWS